MKPLCIDLYAGLGGWAEGFLSEGYDVIGFDIERHDYGTGGYPGQLVLQDALTLHGSQFRKAACIVCSPPCQEYSYMAMPWSIAKAKAAAIRADETGEARRKLTALFDACFRIQREASEAAGRHIPMVVENVRGAQPWVGRAPWNYGSFYLWGDVPALMPFTMGRKNGGGSWFNVAHNTESGKGQNPDGRKVPGMNFHEHEKTGKPGRSFQSAAVDSRKGTGGSCCANGSTGRSGDTFQGLQKQADGSWSVRGEGRCASRTDARKAASAQIAKIPYDLAAHIARSFKPSKEAAA